jgi:hypothetical protein
MREGLPIQNTGRDVEMHVFLACHFGLYRAASVD